MAKSSYVAALLKLGVLCQLIVALMLGVAYGKNLPVNKDGKDEMKNACPFGDQEGAENDSLGYYIPFGGIPFERDLSKATITLHRLKPTPTIHTTASLFYSSPAATYVAISEGNGNAISVGVRQTNGKVYRYSFGSSESLASPVDQYGSGQHLQRLDAAGQPTTSGTPAFYVEYFPSGDSLRFNAVSGIALEYRFASGQVVNFAEISLEVIWDENNYLRQVKSYEGLADIVTINDYTYEIRIYDFYNVGEKDSSGYYVPVGSPYVTYTFTNPNNNASDLNNVRITKVQGAHSIVTDFSYDSASEQWSMSTGNGLKRVEKYVYRDPKTGEEYFVRVLLDGEDNVVSKTYRVVKNFSWGKEVIREVDDPDGFALTTYNEYDTSGNGIGQMKSQRLPDGYWKKYSYDSEGRLTETISPWKDAPFSSAANRAQAFEYGYITHESTDVLTPGDSRPRTETKKILGIPVQRTFYSYNHSGGEYWEVEERAANQLANYGAQGNLRTTTVYYDAASGTIAAGRKKTVSVQAVGTGYGTVTTYSYAYDAGSSDARFTETMVHGTVSHPEGVAHKTTKVEKVYSFQGLLMAERNYVYTGSGYQLVSTIGHQYDNELHHVLTTKDGRTTYAAHWVDGFLNWEANEDGIKTVYVFDDLGRIDMEIKEGVPATASYPAQPDIVTSYVRELGAISCGCDGRIVTMISSQDGLLALRSVTSNDKVGRLSSYEDHAGLMTHYSYAEGGRMTTVTGPSSATEVVANYLDQSPKSVTGTGVVARYYDYGVNSDGSTWEEVRLAFPDSPRYERAVTDFLGNVIREEKPSYSGGTYTVSYFYNVNGQLVRQEVPGQAATLYEYDAVGALFRTGLDVDGSGTLALASSDRVVDQEVVYEVLGGVVYRVSRNQVYATPNSAAPTFVGENRFRVSGYGGNLAEETISVDMHGNETLRRVERDFANRLTVMATTIPGSIVDVVSVSYNGLVQGENSATVEAPVVYGYDALGRLVSSRQPRHTQASTTTYSSSTGQMTAQTDAVGNVMTYSYYAGGSAGAGQVSVIENALGKRTYLGYDLQGRQVSSWGQTDYPVAVTYDSYGQLSTLTTWRDAAGTIDFSGTAWPNPAGGDVTTWLYQASTGLLTRKQYANSDGVDYTYDVASRLLTRTWARGVVTTYGYDGASGQLASTAYSDGVTEPIAYTYNRLGQLSTVIDASGERTFTYNSQLQQAKEIFDSTTFSGRILTRKYQTGAEANSLFGRNAGYELGTAVSPDADQGVSYGYDNAGRLLSVASATDTFIYGRVPNSDLLAGMIGPVHTVEYAYEANRDARTQVENIKTLGAPATVSSYAYSYDVLGRREARSQGGTAFTASSVDTFGYDDRSEVIGSVNDVTVAFDFAYAYDSIGNRKASEAGSAPARVYTANALNQYTSITNPSLSPTYDADGNLTSNGAWTFTWDGENRLISATDGVATVYYVYDYMSRLIERTQGATTTSYIYDNWNRIATLSGSSVTSTNLWGLDLSLSLQGVGGVGGLLKEGGVYPLYDANGNIVQKLDISGVVAMAVVYDPFGNIISGSLVGEYGFSTKILDALTGFYYYGYRWYDPVDGRWISRDPIEESGGVNLYGMIKNNPLNDLDLLGMKPCSSYSKSRPKGDGSHEGRTRNQGKKPSYNGCGAENGFKFPEEDLFYAHFRGACNQHDVCYSTCGSKRTSCDSLFRRDLMQACEDVYSMFNIPMKAACRSQAHAYYVAVSHGGRSAYNTAQDDHCKWECCTN